MTVPDTFHGLLAALSSNPVFLASIVYLILGYLYGALPQLTSQAKAAGSVILPLALASGAYATGAGLGYWPWGIEPFYQVVLVAVFAAGGAKLIHSGTERLSDHAAGLFTLIGQQVNGTQNWQSGGDQFQDATRIDGVVAGSVGTQTTNVAAATSRIVLTPEPAPNAAAPRILGTAPTWGANGVAANQLVVRPEPAPEPAPPVFLGGYDLPHVAGPPPTLHVPAHTAGGSTFDPAPELTPEPEPAPSPVAADTTLEDVRQDRVAPEPEPLPPPVPEPPPLPVSPPWFTVPELLAWIEAHRAADTARIAAAERGESV